MQRFFVEPYQIEEEMHRIHINGTDVNHIKNVLRMKCGEDVWISDGGNKERMKFYFIFFMHRNRNMNFQTRFIFFRDFQKQIRWNSLFRKRWSWELSQ